MRQLDVHYSDWLCIPRSKKITTIKPDGTLSLLSGTSPGIHYPHAEYYIRRIRIASNSKLCPVLEEAGYHWEYEVIGRTQEEREKTKVFEFPVHCEYFDKAKEDATIWEQVKNTADMQTWFADNSVSVTVTFKKEEAKDIPNVLEAYENVLKSISLLPLSDAKYKLMPYETITKEKYEEMWKGIKPIDFKSINLYVEDEVMSDSLKYCTNDSCEIPAELLK